VAHEPPRDAPADVDDLFAMLHGSAAWDDLEGLSILEHGLQTAAILRDQFPDDVELQVAGLVHDLGWMARDTEGHWQPVADAAHDREGAARLRPLLGVRVGALVAGHVAAKRYLVATDPEYRSVLSERSLATLVFQGEVMTDDEAREFERATWFDDVIALRRADDQAKVVGLAVEPLEAWRDALDVVSAG
jgi:predicted HD phosphohydrolase